MFAVDICFEFLQVALGTRQSLSRPLYVNDWLTFYIFCKQQALLGVGFAAVEQLHEQGMECPKELRMRWMAAALRIEAMSGKQNRQCRELTELLEHDGLRCCILKGQGNLQNYPERLKLRRNPGDIDVWCIYHGCQSLIKYARTLNAEGKKNKAVYHHIKANVFDDTEVELHYRPSFLHSLIRNYRMQRFFSSHADECMKNKNHLGFATPTPSVNVIYQMCHLFSHFLETGIGLRQMMDYYFLLMQWHKQVGNVEYGVLSDGRQEKQSQGMWSEGLGTPIMSKEEVMHTLRSFGMGKFAAAVMWVLHEVFAMPIHYYICEPNEKEGRKLLAEIMRGGNFGHYDERGKKLRNGGTIPHAVWKLKRVMRLASSYPEEALCEPFFRVWHWGWRCLH